MRNPSLDKTLSEPQSPRHLITPETLFSVRNASSAAIAPDGKRVAFIVGDWLDDQKKQRHRLWLCTSHGSDPEPLTTGMRHDSSPCWSPDGRYIAFASKIDGAHSAQLYVIDTAAEGGEPQQVCKTPNDVSHVSWSPDGKRIAFLARSGSRPEIDPLVLHPGEGRHRLLWTVRLSGDTPEVVTPPDYTIWHYSWSPDSRNFALYYASGPDETDWYRGQLGLVAASGGDIRQLGQLTRQACGLTWSPDSTRIAYISGEWSDPDRGGGEIYVYSLTDAGNRNLTPELNWSPTWCQWFPDGRHLLCAGWDGLTTRISLLDEVSGTQTSLDANFLLGDRGWPHLSATPDMHFVAATHSERHPYDVWLGELAGRNRNALSWKRLTRLNPIAEETLSVAPTHRISYDGSDDWRIDALVTWPQQYSGEHPPLIVNIHGGPSGVWPDDWGQYRTQMLAAAGFAVFCPNIRGSMGRGAAFADAVIGDMGGKDLQDILRGIDHLISHNLVDGNRLGVMGWSYGGFLSAWAITQTERFKAAVVGAGITDYHSFHAQTNIQDWDMRFLGQTGTPVSPLTHPDLYRTHSPITYARNIATPTLIVHGAQDPCVPAIQARALFRALAEQYIPTELVIYPREGHGLSERAHNLDYMQRVLSWFKRYLS